jgi:hypothetical protein
MNWPQLDIGNWIAIGSATIALLSLWNAIMARRIAKGSYLLAAQARDRTTPSLELYIDHGYIRRLTAPAKKVFTFRVVITNRSDAPNSLKSARLLIEHQRGDGPPSRLDVPHDPTCAAALGIAEGDVLKLPAPIGQRAVGAGMLFFPVAQALLADTRIEAYEVLLTDTFDRESRREALLLTERPGGQRQMA